MVTTVGNSASGSGRLAIKDESKSEIKAEKHAAQKDKKEKKAKKEMKADKGDKKDKKVKADDKDKKAGECSQV